MLMIRVSLLEMKEEEFISLKGVKHGLMKILVMELFLHLLICILLASCSFVILLYLNFIQLLFASIFITLLFMELTFSENH